VGLLQPTRPADAGQTAGAETWVTGDRKDASGGLWLGVSPSRRFAGAAVADQCRALPGGSYFNHDAARLKIEDRRSPGCSVRASVVCASVQSRWPSRGTEPRGYTVRLAFAELDHTAAGQACLRHQDPRPGRGRALRRFQAAGGRNKPVIKQFPGIDADKELSIEFVPSVAKPEPDQMPILQGIEVVREPVLNEPAKG